MYLKVSFGEKFFDIFLMLLISFDSVRVPETWSIDDPVTMLIIYTFVDINCKIGRDVLGFRFHLSICVLHDDLVAKGILLVDHRQVVDDCVQKSGFSAACFAEHNHGFGLVLHLLGDDTLRVLVEVDPSFSSYLSSLIVSRTLYLWNLTPIFLVKSFSFDLSAGLY